MYPFPRWVQSGCFHEQQPALRPYLCTWNGVQVLSSSQPSPQPGSLRAYELFQIHSLGDPEATPQTPASRLIHIFKTSDIHTARPAVFQRGHNTSSKGAPDSLLALSIRSEKSRPTW